MLKMVARADFYQNIIFGRVSAHRERSRVLLQLQDWELAELNAGVLKQLVENVRKLFPDIEDVDILSYWVDRMVSYIREIYNIFE